MATRACVRRTWAPGSAAVAASSAISVTEIRPRVTFPQRAGVTPRPRRWVEEAYPQESKIAPRSPSRSHRRISPSNCASIDRTGSTLTASSPTSRVALPAFNHPPRPAAPPSRSLDRLSALGHAARPRPEPSCDEGCQFSSQTSSDALGSRSRTSWATAS